MNSYISMYAYDAKEHGFHQDNEPGSDEFEGFTIPNVGTPHYSLGLPSVPKTQN